MRARTHNADWLDNTSTTIDLRKKLSEQRTDTIRDRAEWLNPDEQTLVLAVFRDGYTAAQVARLYDEDPRTVRRRIKRAIERLHDPRFLYVMRHKDAWSQSRRRVALAVFRSGLSIRRAAHELNLSIHHVRRHRDAVLAMMPKSSPDRTWR